MGRHGRLENFRIGPSLSNRNGRFEFESNLEASQVPSMKVCYLSTIVIVPHLQYITGTLLIPPYLEMYHIFLLASDNLTLQEVTSGPRHLIKLVAV